MPREAPAVKRQHPERPDRTTLERLLRAGDGKLTRLAALLDVSRPTLYKWIYQLDLAGVAGISSVSAVDGLYGERVQPEQNTEKAVKPLAIDERRLHGVSSIAIATDPRVNTSIRIRESIWKRMRKRAIDEGRPVAELLEDAAAAYLAERAGKVDAEN
jgi:hypothetical protein